MVNMQICLVLFVVAVLFTIVSYFVKKELLRNLIYIPSIVVAIFCISSIIGYFIRMTERFNYNMWYSMSTNELIVTVIDKLENGEEELVLKELKILESQIHPTYEVRGNYDELVDETVKRLDATENSDSGAVEEAL